MRTPARPVVVSLIWMILGAVALVAVTVGITVSIASLRTADRTAELVTQLRHANTQIDELRTESTGVQQQAAADHAQATAERDQLRRQAEVTQAQLLAVLAYLRANGIDIPPTVVNPPTSTSPRPRPKATGPRGPQPSTTSQPRPSPSPSPHPNSGTTTAPGTAELACLLAPTLCPILHP